PRGEVAAGRAVEEEMAEEADPQAPVAAWARARRVEARQRGLEHRAQERAVAALQPGVLPPLVGEVEIGPARVVERGLRVRIAEGARRGFEAPEARVVFGAHR